MRRSKKSAGQRLQESCHLVRADRCRIAAGASAQPSPQVTSLCAQSSSHRLSAPTLSTGRIGKRLGFALPAAFLESLGFQPTATAAPYYPLEQFPATGNAAIELIRAVVDEYLALPACGIHSSIALRAPGGEGLCLIDADWPKQFFGSRTTGRVAPQLGCHLYRDRPGRRQRAAMSRAPAPAISESGVRMKRDMFTLPLALFGASRSASSEPTSHTRLRSTGGPPGVNLERSLRRSLSLHAENPPRALPVARRRIQKGDRKSEERRRLAVQHIPGQHSALHSKRRRRAHYSHLLRSSSFSQLKAAV